MATFNHFFEEQPIIRKDTTAEDCFRTLHQNFYPKIYGYAVNQLTSQEEALAMTNTYFSDMANRIPGIPEPNELSDRLSTEIHYPHEAGSRNR